MKAYTVDKKTKEIIDEVSSREEGERLIELYQKDKEEYDVIGVNGKSVL